MVSLVVILMLAVTIAIIAIVIWVQKVIAERKESETTETTKGVLSSFYPRDAKHYTWMVSYTVDHHIYSTRIDVSGMSEKEMKEHINDSVVVHYDPSDPRKAWASVPGCSDH